MLLNNKKFSKEFIKDKIKEWTEGNSYTASDCKDIFESGNEKPWNKTKHFHKEDAEGILQILKITDIFILEVMKEDSSKFQEVFWRI